MNVYNRGLALSNSKGFTLIELLVVIAIIGILSSVVLSSLNSARGKGGNAGIKANLSNIRTQAEILYDNNSTNPSTYVGLCTESTIAKATAAAATITGATVNNIVSTAGASNLVSCHTPGSGVRYAIAAPLRVPENGNLYWCVDSTGFSGLKTPVIPQNQSDCSY